MNGSDYCKKEGSGDEDKGRRLISLHTTDPFTEKTSV